MLLSAHRPRLIKVPPEGRLSDADVGGIDVNTLMKIAVITPGLDDWPAFGGAGAVVSVPAV